MLLDFLGEFFGPMLWRLWIVTLVAGTHVLCVECLAAIRRVLRVISCNVPWVRRLAIRLGCSDL